MMKENINSLIVRVVKLAVSVMVGWSITVSAGAATVELAGERSVETMDSKAASGGLATPGTGGPVIGTDDPVCPPQDVDTTPPVITISDPLPGSTSTGSYIKIKADITDAETELYNIFIYARDLVNGTYTKIKTFHGDLGNNYSLTYYYNPPVYSSDYDFVIMAISHDSICMTSTAATEEVQNIHYVYQASPIQQANQAITANPANLFYDEYGHSIAMDEIGQSWAHAIIGAPNAEAGPNNINGGAAYLMERNPTNPNSLWSTTAKIDLGTNAGVWDRFGKAVALAWNSTDGWAFVGAPGKDDKGAVLVFERNGSGNWSLHQTLAPTTLSINARFGDALSLNYYTNTKRLAVGAPGDDAVYLYERDNNNMWFQVLSQPITGNVGSDFGQSVLLYASELFVGAPDESVNSVFRAGAAYVYNMAGAQQARLTAAQPEPYDQLGKTLARVEVYAPVYTLLVGAPEADITVDGNVNSDQGAVFVFKRSSTGWVDTTELQKITAPDGDAGDRFGHALTNWRYPYVGAPSDDLLAQNQGAVYQLVQNSDDTFSQFDKLYLTFPIASHRFGFSLAESETLLIGAPNCGTCSPQNNTNPGTVYWLQ